MFSILGAVFLSAGLVLWIVAANQMAAAAEDARRVPWVLGAVFLAVGGTVGLVGGALGLRRLAFLRRQDHLRKHGQRTAARVTSLEPTRVRVNGRSPWLVTYEYTVGGINQTGSDQTFDLPAGLAVGSQLEVRYDPANPTECVLDLSNPNPPSHTSPGSS